MICKADIIIKSSQIWTGNIDETIYGGIAIKKNRILYVGFQDLDKYIGPNTKILDYGDQLVIPGIHDGHVHMLMTALMNSGKCPSLYDAKSEKECVDIVKRYDKPQNLIGGWIIGMGWYQLLWDNKKLPTKKSLDNAFPDTPVFLMDSNAHTTWVNSEALRRLNFTPQNTKDNIDFGKFENGELTGIIGEASFMKLSSQIMTADEKTTSKLFIDTIKRMNSFGITQIDDVAGSAFPDSDQIADQSWKQIYSENKLNIRVNLFPTLLDDFSRIHQIENNCGRATGDSMIGIAGVKSFFDGVSSMHTAYLSEPYSDAQNPDDRGHLTIKPDVMQRRVLKAAKEGYCVKIHAIGDGAVTEALNVYENVEKELDNKVLSKVQFNIEHLENIEEKDIERLRDLNVIASVQPAHALIDPAGEEKDLGEKRTKMMWPFRHYLARGTKIAFGTDSPVVDFNPFENLYNAVTRKSINGGKPWESQNSINIQEALRAYTLGSARCSNRQKDLGTIENGKLADIAVLNCNILKSSPEDCLKTNAVMTMVNGKIVYGG